MTYREILCEVKDGIATITLHRPDKLDTQRWDVMGPMAIRTLCEDQ